MDFKLGLSQLLPEDIKAAQDMKNNANKVDKVTAGRGIGPRRGTLARNREVTGYSMREPAPKSGPLGRRVPARWPGTSDMPVTNSAVRPALHPVGTTEGGLALLTT